MKVLKLKINLLSAICFMLVSTSFYAQEGHITINQDKNISNLLALKKELNKDEDAPNRYKIQIYNGSRAGANAAQKEFHSNYSDWHSKIVFDTPNFKIWAGNFRTRLEADRALKRIKKNFPNAFIFRPKK
ncbi:SPOR domain-containing protein [Hwangdonia lutea]|uniref:SPOR domain-containing protein n=1 Tax=Hwangdonia lutea TaxID=3075823 RepID=A0AA97HNI6_9FLAO|nr:SPOR domain-containing protein [Hwangdonia sp. SCSIO 19198]WOD42076.1 SPOR domain-containing protein [Hwangdonia sp. SCSIO 19198]